MLMCHRSALGAYCLSILLKFADNNFRTVNCFYLWPSLFFLLTAWRRVKVTFESAGSCRDTQAIWAAAVFLTITKLSLAREIWPGKYSTKSVMFLYVRQEGAKFTFWLYFYLWLVHCGTSKPVSRRHRSLATRAMSCRCRCHQTCALSSPALAMLQPR